MFGNVGFMGYPVVASIFGHQAVFYAAVLNVVNTFAVFTIGTMLVTGGEGTTREKFKEGALQHAHAFSLSFHAHSGSRHGPGSQAFISQPLTMIGNITVPAALLIIGSSMSHLSPRTMLGTAPSTSPRSSAWSSCPWASTTSAGCSASPPSWSTSTPSSSPCPWPPTAPSSA